MKESNQSFMKLLQIFIFNIFVLCLTVQMSEALEWQFIGDRLPRYVELVSDDGNFLDLECHEQREILYTNYLKRHPGYRPFMNAPEMRKEWRRAMVNHQIDNNLDSFSFCVYSILQNTVFDLPRRHDKRDKIFCGVMGEPLNSLEKAAAQSLQELMGYAIRGSVSANLQLLGVSDLFPLVRLNNDVRYYLQGLLRKLTASTPSLWDVAKSLVLPVEAIDLSLERRMFIENTVARGDHTSVLETTNPCNFMEL